MARPDPPPCCPAGRRSRQKRRSGRAYAQAERSEPVTVQPCGAERRRYDERLPPPGGLPERDAAHRPHMSTYGAELSPRGGERDGQAEPDPRRARSRLPGPRGHAGRLFVISRKAAAGGVAPGIGLTLTGGRGGRPRPEGPVSIEIVQNPQEQESSRGTEGATIGATPIPRGLVS